MSWIADAVAYGPDGQLTLIVEAKSKTKTSRSWAKHMRRNLLSHGVVPKSRFLLLALPDRLYLWKDVNNAPDLIDPTYEIDAAPLFEPYFAMAQISPDQLTPQSFELIVNAWLNELIHSGIPENVPPEARQALLDSGLLGAIKGGSVAVEVSV